MRWPLFIDKIKLVTSELLGQVISFLQVHMDDANKFKFDARGR